MPFGQALYPAIIVALVALNRSPIDNGIRRKVSRARETAHAMDAVSVATAEFDPAASENI